MADQSLFAENQFLTSHAQEKHGSFRLPELDVGLADIHRVLKGWGIGLRILVKGLRVLALKLEAHPVGRADAHIEPQAAEDISVTRVRLESTAVESFEA